MKGLALLASFVLFTGLLANAQTKVANYAYGEPGTDNYEELSFWVKNGRKSTIDYTYGKDRKTVNVNLLGRFQANNPYLKVQFPNGFILYLTPLGNVLRVTDSKPTYQKTFKWQYEGPENGIGTFCSVCAQDDKEAMRLIQSYFMR